MSETSSESASGTHDGDQREPASIREVAYADADYVLRWLRQSNAPPNIVALQERATAYLGVASGR